MAHIILTALLSFLLITTFADSKIGFWDVQRKGANVFNNHERLENFEAAKKFGIQVLRLAPNKWLNGRNKKELGDFLIGNSSTNTVPIAKDVDYLKSILDDTNKAGAKIILTLLSLPQATVGYNITAVNNKEKYGRASKLNTLRLSFGST